MTFSALPITGKSPYSPDAEAAIQQQFLVRTTIADNSLSNSLQLHLMFIFILLSQDTSVVLYTR